MKAFGVALFLVTLTYGAYSLNATYGNIYGYNPLLTRDLVIRNPSNGQIISHDYLFPKPGQTNSHIISGIRVIDNFKDNTGAVPNMWAGGPGYNFTFLDFKSQLSRGINSTVEIYGN